MAKTPGDRLRDFGILFQPGGQRLEPGFSKTAVHRFWPRGARTNVTGELQRPQQSDPGRHSGFDSLVPQQSNAALFSDLPVSYDGFSYPRYADLTYVFDISLLNIQVSSEPTACRRSPGRVSPRRPTMSNTRAHEPAAPMVGPGLGRSAMAA